MRDELARRFRNILISLDQTLFCLATLGHSNPDETASSAAWRGEKKGKRLAKFFRPLIDAIWFQLFGEASHCELSYMNELHQRKEPM